MESWLGDCIVDGWLEVIRIHGRAAQHAAYVHALERLGDAPGPWVGFIDLDEFIVLDPGWTGRAERPLADYLAMVPAGGLALMRIEFGPSGWEEPPSHPQLKALHPVLGELSRLPVPGSEAPGQVRLRRQSPACP